MIDPAYVQRMARYNRWQNAESLWRRRPLPDEERRRERGAFFGSIHKTLSHLLWGDRIWMSRFTDVPKPQGGIPESVSLYPDWDGLKRERAAFDETMIAWADKLDAAWLAGDLTWYSGAREARRHQAEVDAGDAHVQSPDPPSRAGALHADAGRRQAARHRPAVHAGVTR